MSKRNVIILFIIFIHLGCSHHIISESLKKTPSYISYDPTYFIGSGIGSNEKKEIAYKVAKLNALGNLSENIEIEVLSVLDYYVSEKNTGEIDDTLNKQIVIISSTKIRDPIYTIIEEEFNGSNYSFKVTVKKERNKYFLESATDLNYNDAGEMLINLFKEKLKSRM